MNINKEKIIGTFTVANRKRMDIFRIHLFEKSIRFDEHFAIAIAKNKALIKNIYKISEDWSNKKIKHNEAFVYVLNELKKYEGYLSEYYFSKEDLNEEGRLVEPMPINTLEKNTLKKEIQQHYEHLKNANLLKPISKKEFEKNIKESKISEFYIENYPKGKIDYYVYKAFIDDKIKNCFLLIKNNNVFLGFEE